MKTYLICPLCQLDIKVEYSYEYANDIFNYIEIHESACPVCRQHYNNDNIEYLIEQIEDDENEAEFKLEDVRPLTDYIQGKNLIKDID